MDFLYQVKRAFISVFDNKWRSIITMTSIIIGTGIAMATLFISRGFADNIIDYLIETSNGVILLEYYEKSDISSDAKSGIVDKSGMMYTSEQVETIRQLPFVRDVITKNSEADVAVSYLDTEIAQQYLETLDLNEKKTFNKNYQLILGDMFSDTDFIDGTQSILLHEDAAAQLFRPDDNPIGRELMINNHIFLIKGVYQDKQERWRLHVPKSNPFFIPFNTWIAYTGFDEIQTFGIIPLKIEYLAEAALSVEQKLNEDDLAHGSYKVMNLAVLANEVESKMMTMTLGGLLIAALALFFGGMSVMNIMYVSVMERRHEIGVAKALGASARQIRQQFLLESIVLTSIGGTCGIILGFIGHIIGSWILAYDFLIYPDIFFIGWMLALALGLAFGALPAQRAAQVKAAEALRHL